MRPFVITSAVNKSLNGGLNAVNLQPSNGLKVNRPSSNNYGKSLPSTVKQPKTKPAMVENLTLR